METFHFLKKLELNIIEETKNSDPAISLSCQKLTPTICITLVDGDMQAFAFYVVSFL